MSKIAIIGTRNPSQRQLVLAAAAARKFSFLDYVIATGAAMGIDHAAMLNATPKNLRVYLPWYSYNSGIIPRDCTHKIVYDELVHLDWRDSVIQYHPNPSFLTQGAFKLHARNFGIIEGSCLVCAFPQEDGNGGTRQGIRIATGLGIKVVTVLPSTTLTVDKFLVTCLRELIEKPVSS